MKENAHILRTQDICLPSFLRDLTQSFGVALGTQWHIDCPHIHLFIDRTLLRTILSNVLTAGLHFSSDPLILSLQAKETAEGVCISLYTFLVAPTLSGEASPYQSMPTLIVGPPGLLLSVADLLAASCNGSVEVEKKHQGDFVSAFTLSDDDLESTAKHYRLVCRLSVPVRGMGEEASCASC